MAQDFIEVCKSEVHASRAYTHPFLAELTSRPMDRKGAEQFAMQWYKAAIAHKKSFPGLIYSTAEDKIRLQLIDILREEYGFGEERQIHSIVLEKFLFALDLDVQSAIAARAEPEIDLFSQGIDEAWARGDSVEGFGVHFSLECLAARMHEYFYAAVSTIENIGDEDIEYFKIHSVVELEHRSSAECGMRILTSNPSCPERLLRGVRQGIRLVDLLLDGLQRAYRKGNAMITQPCP